MLGYHKLSYGLLGITEKFGNHLVGEIDKFFMHPFVSYHYFVSYTCRQDFKLSKLLLETEGITTKVWIDLSSTLQSMCI